MIKQNRENRRQAAIARRQAGMKKSGGASLAFNSYLAKQKANMDSSIWDKKNAYDRQQRASVQATNLGIEQSNNQIRMKTDEMNMRSRAKVRDFEAKAAQQLSEWNQRNRLDRTKKNQDQLNLDAFNIALDRYLTTDEGKKWLAAQQKAQYTPTKVSSKKKTTKKDDNE